MPAATDSVFDIAFWFSDRALNDNEYLQPVKLQYLLYLSQSYFAVAYNGKKLVPAIFIAEETGPVEPSVHRAWTRGRPTFDGNPVLSDDVHSFVDSIWRRLDSIQLNIFRNCAAARQRIRRLSKEVIAPK